MASDPFADALNTSGMGGIYGPNPYLQYTGKIPMAGYTGTPTDASGNPIQSFVDAQKAHDAWAPPAPAPAQGTTLNSAPNANTGLQMGAMYPGGPMVNQNPNYSSLGGRPPPPGWYGNSAINADKGSAAGNWTPAYAGGPMQGQQGAAAAAAAPAAPTNPIDMRQAYLNALSNPGKVTTPGAQMLPGAAPTGPIGNQQPSVMESFLAGHPSGGTTGGGGYSNTGFFNTLNALKQPGATT